MSTKISLPPFIPQRNAEVDHVTRRNLHTLSHHALLMWCTALRHWCNFCVTTNFPYLRQQSRTVAKWPQPEGPTLGWRCFLWWKYLQQSLHICQMMCEWHLVLPHWKVENKLNNVTISFSVFFKNKSQCLSQQALGSVQWHTMDRSPVHHRTHRQSCVLQRRQHTLTACICCNVQHTDHWAEI